ncbi:hypothetical protein GCM10022204_17830 [Microlunatus aurantiacus]|uniref:EVE domain-containing protein n=1 Tax=Microlunatus aurantiacus TaxID=446786 RepID=A0ABP7D9K4_9ACTN
MAYFLFNVRDGDAARAALLLRAGWWPVDVGEPHRNSLTSGDLVLVYVAAPSRFFLGRAVLASDVQDRDSSERADTATGRVTVTGVEEWDPPVPMAGVLARIDRSAGARADFATGVVRITEEEYTAALSVAAERPTG